MATLASLWTLNQVMIGLIWMSEGCKMVHITTLECHNVVVSILHYKHCKWVLFYQCGPTKFGNTKLVSNSYGSLVYSQP